MSARTIEFERFRVRHFHRSKSTKHWHSNTFHQCLMRIVLHYVVSLWRTGRPRSLFSSHSLSSSSRPCGCRRLPRGHHMQLLGHALAPPVRRILDAPPRPLRRAGHPYVRDTPPRAVLRRLGLGRRTVVVGLLDHLRVWLEDGLARLQQRGGATRSHIPRSTRAHSLLRRLARPRAGAPSLWRRGR